MNRFESGAAAIALFVFTCMSFAQTPATLHIDLGKPLHNVSPTLYGMMTEEINYSYDGGLYAEMVRNRTMEHDWSGLAHWRLVELGHSSAAFGVDSMTGPSAALETSLKVDVKQADRGSRAGVLNEGWWGMALRANTRYEGSFYAKADSSAIGPVEASLVNDNTGEVIASAVSEPLTTGWKRYGFTMKTGSNLKESSDNHLRLTVAHPGVLWLDLVSLFPPTYNSRPNGNRIDLMEKMAAMKPAFLRLPGGNYLEGDDIQDRYDWKKTIGPLVDRATHPSPWGYQSSDGMGLLEFLEWCEDLKIQPVLAVYAGYSLKGAHVAPGPYLSPFVDDALEEIEFVSGAASTRWGGVRAKLGHPAPFPLTYVEIGNEDQFDKSGSYDGRYAQFYQAIKAKYPALQIIATTPVTGIKPDVVDDHFYKQATEFFKMADHYDATTRDGPKIFVGEWATREGSPTTNLGAALGDAAWMTGLERNSDLIVMASYAPLFVNVNPGGMQWSSDLIGYDALSSYGSPGYYAQVMFAQHLGTSVPASSMTGAPDRFFYSVTNNPGSGAVDVKLVNANSVPQALQIDLTGQTPVEGKAQVTTLAGSTTAETNTIDHPERVMPVASEETIAGKTFSHVVPAYSIQVIELRVVR